jgi:uncharacterized protein YbjT (DUF2867 family)
MADKKIIAVLGATGSQGGGLARAILNDRMGAFAVRALTRDPNSEKAQELSKLGAEVVKADANSMASLRAAFDGVFGAYCVTFFWEHFLPEKELAQASAMATAAKMAGVKHVIWSTLEDTRLKVPLKDKRMPTLMEHYKVPHFDAKGESDQAFRQAGGPTTYLRTSFYWENFIYFGLGPKRQPDGTLALTLPMGDKKLPGIAAEDIGRCAYGIFRKGVEYIGQTIGIAGEHLTGGQMAAALTRALGQEVRYDAVTPEEYRGYDNAMAKDVANMFQYTSEFEKDFCGDRNVETSRSLNPDLLNFDHWLAKNKDRIPLEG